MRGVGLADVIVLARCLLSLPQSGWKKAVSSAFEQAHIADKVRKKTHKLHPTWGNGSLTDALTGWPKSAEPFLTDPIYLDALIAVLIVLRAKQTSHALASARNHAMYERQD